MAAIERWRYVARSPSSPFPMATKLVIYGLEDSGTENIAKNVEWSNFDDFLVFDQSDSSILIKLII